ncbi:MAG TPA: potassium-transporting ATPase subunit KdpA [Thermodesulfobacteriota bacterium]|nr:potassium-transporting ATPase subunit KdpA [Thermodesulfobacteriota bacterium]
MYLHEGAQIVLYLVFLVALTPVLGLFMAKVFNDEHTWLTPLLRPLEKTIYRLAGIDENEEMRWSTYVWALLIFNFLGFVVVFVIQMIQDKLPLNPQKLSGVSVDLAFNTAVSFMTNTNWQSYAGETTLSYFTQMLGLTVQNFLSAATGVAVLLALTRGLTRRSLQTIGNFWVDLVRTTLYVFLPLAFILAIILVGQGVVQTFSPAMHIQTLEGHSQIIPLGPAASQIAIKQLGTNGGGFFNANSAYPLENPTPLSNFLQMFSLLLIPAALTYTYGKMVGSRRQGWAIFAAMMTLFLVGLVVSLWAEYGFNPVTGIAASMEGKEVRFGIANSVLWATATTAASNGSVIAMHSSLSPLAGLVAMFNIMLGEVIFGGVGAGLYGMLVFVILTVFIAGLMVGRTPEYLGKKIEAFEVKMSMLAVIAPSLVILVFSSIASVTDAGLSSLGNQGPHGLSEILYAFSSAAGNNGSAFAGLNANTTFYNIMLGISMLIGRFAVIVPVLAIAGSMANKKIAPFSAGMFQTDNATFVALLVATVIIVGGLTFFPALSLGPIVEHLLMRAGHAF